VCRRLLGLREDELHRLDGLDHPWYHHAPALPIHRDPTPPAAIHHQPRHPRSHLEGVPARQCHEGAGDVVARDPAQVGH
jgi:hypothetical protein